MHFGVFTILASKQASKQACVAALRSLVNPFLPNFTENREATIFYGTGGLCL